jgi:hypothetical protein
MSDTGPEILGSRLTRDVTTLRTGPLVATGAVGLILVLLYVVLELGEDPPRLSGLLLEIGAGLMLFALLLVVQVKLVERAISSARGLTEQDLAAAQAEGGLNPLTPGDFHDDIGPLAVAGAVVRDLADGNLRDAWLLFDPNWKRCRAMSWLYNNREQVGLPADLTDEVEQLAEELAQLHDVAGGLTDHFVASEAHDYADLLRGFDDDRWGWSQRRRIVGPRHEIVLALPLPTDAPHGIVVDRPMIVTRAIKILVSYQSAPDGTPPYLVAGINCEAAPLPTWPPTSWVIDDPAAVASHPGVGSTSPVVD